MLYRIDGGRIEKEEFYSFKDLGLKEKDLENLISNSLEEIFNEDKIITIFQERAWQEEPDIIGINEVGDLVIFELKRELANDSTAYQILRYAEKFGRYNYESLNRLWKTYTKNKNMELKEKHKEAFGLLEELSTEDFNKNQKMIIVGNSLDIKLIKSIDYWKGRGLNLDFIPYRVYKFGEKLYLEFFSKDYDYHLNPRDRKAIIFDTNKTYGENDIWYMFDNSRISAFGNATRYIDSFNINDYVLYYHKGYGIVAAGRILSEAKENKSRDEKYREVEFLTQLPVEKNEKELKSVSANEMKTLLNKDFFFASTIKSPYLTIDEANEIIDALNKK